MHASFDFRLPLGFEDEFAVHLLIEEAGSRTIRYRAQIVRDADLIGTGVMIMACVRKRAGEPMKAVEIPAFVREALGV